MRNIKNGRTSVALTRCPLLGRTPQEMDASYPMPPSAQSTQLGQELFLSPLPQASGALDLLQACKREGRSPILEEVLAIVVVLKELYLSIRNWNKQLQWDLNGKNPLENRIARNSCLNLITEKASKLMGWNRVRTRGKDVLSPGKEKSVLQGCERNTTSRIKKGVLHY